METVQEFLLKTKTVISGGKKKKKVNKDGGGGGNGKKRRKGGGKKKKQAVFSQRQATSHQSKTNETNAVLRCISG